MAGLADLSLVSAFVAVAEERHFRRAAERLHLAQPVISRRIQRLERDIGVALLERSTRQVTLTDAGVEFLGTARQLLHDADVAVARTVRVAQGVLGRLTVGFVESAVFGLLTPLLRELDRRVPALTLELRELSTEQQLNELQADVDIAIVRELGIHELAAEGLSGEHLLRERLMVALPHRHRLATRERLPLAELADLPFVLFPRPPVPRLHDHLVAVCGEANFYPNIVAHAAQYPTMLAMVAAGRGLSLVPSCVRTIRPEGVKLIPVADDHAATNLSLAWSNGLSPALETFIDAAHSVVATVTDVHYDTMAPSGDEAHQSS
ncbi:MAG: LysR family transcriptional regulator [Nitriliruptoraceae bacterium]